MAFGGFVGGEDFFAVKSGLLGQPFFEGFRVLQFDFLINHSIKDMAVCNVFGVCDRHIDGGSKARQRFHLIAPDDVFGTKVGVVFECFDVFAQNGLEVGAVRTEVAEKFEDFDFACLLLGNRRAECGVVKPLKLNKDTLTCHLIVYLLQYF